MADNGTTVDVELGGPVTQGEPFTWVNNSGGKIKASGLAGVCADDVYHVPAAANGKAGEKPASVLPHAPTGPHTYQTGPGEGTPSLTVNNSMPRPKK
jgi:hypothetical protein